MRVDAVSAVGLGVRVSVVKLAPIWSGIRSSMGVEMAHWLLLAFVEEGEAFAVELVDGFGDGAAPRYSATPMLARMNAYSSATS